MAIHGKGRGLLLVGFLQALRYPHHAQKFTQTDDDLDGVLCPFIMQVIVRVFASATGLEIFGC